MEERNRINTTEKILEIIRKIKAFTVLSPSIESMTDPSYKRYLASCARLLELDFQLNSLQQEDELEYDDFVESLLTIEQEVDECTKWLM